MVCVCVSLQRAAGNYYTTRKAPTTRGHFIRYTTTSYGSALNTITIKRRRFLFTHTRETEQQKQLRFNTVQYTTITNYEP